MNKSFFRIFIIWLVPFLLVVTFVVSGSCRKRSNNQLVDLPNRVVSQIETHQGIVQSTATFQYVDDRIDSRNHSNNINQVKFDFEYSSDQVISYFSRKYDDEWYNTHSTVYNFSSNHVVEILYRDFKNDEWVIEERWTFSYNGDNYDEILMENVVNGKYLQETKFDYEYDGDTLKKYTMYNFNNEWLINSEVAFDYLEGRLDFITLFYARFGFDFGPQERFNYYYTDNYNTRVVTAVKVDTGWSEQGEIIREYDINGNMIIETVQQLIGNNENAYRYEYTYELGLENLEIFPFYDEPLYDYIYPTPNSDAMLKRRGLISLNKQRPGEY